ncbi:MAG TPA: hypothetical protein VG052_16630 [Puia sp.]|nr:hypothetical protein [Puia sp.]
MLAFLLADNDASAQSKRTEPLAKKQVSDSILGRRTLVLPDPFDGFRALRRLFPGKSYMLGQENGNTVRLINWVCPSCKQAVYPDANRVEDPLKFPHSDGVATRLINVYSYTDSGGRQCRVISFNHSDYDPDGLQTIRFRGGLLGMAKFVQIDSGWRLEIFQPAIAAYGSFSQCPIPVPLLIGNHQYAYIIRNFNGGPGGPFWLDNSLVTEVGNSYRQILAAPACGRRDGGRDISSWDCSYHAFPRKKQAFRNIVIICKGHYFAADKEGLPEGLKEKVKGSYQGNFKITHVFVYSRKKGYQERLPTMFLVLP